MSFTVDATYPLLDEGSAFPEYVRQHSRTERGTNDEIKPGDQKSWCDTCSFRPWATKGAVQKATVTVVRAAGGTEQVDATLTNGRWSAPADLYKGDVAFVEQGGVEDNYGEVNSQRSATVQGVREPVRKIETGLSLVIEGAQARRVRGARLYEALSPTVGIAGQRIDFFAHGVFVRSVVTDAGGFAAFKPAKNKDSSVYEARYAGNDQYTAASTRPL